MDDTPQQQNRETAKSPGLLRQVLHFFGVASLEEGRWHFRLRKRFFALITFCLAVAVLGLSGLTVYSTSPSFCNSCHIMNPYYDAWAESVHKGVACVECHYPPASTKTILWKKFQSISQVVKYMTRTYSSKPYAEVEDASCLKSGCHSTRLLRGKVISEKGILFDHKPHLENVRRGRQLRCTSCHSQIVVGKHIEVTWDTCFLCHLNGRSRSHGELAQGPPAEGGIIPVSLHQGAHSAKVQSPTGRGNTSQEKTPSEGIGHKEMLVSCESCHLLPDEEINVEGITYNHKEFLGQHKVACTSCHMNSKSSGGEVDRDRCITCHNETEKLGRFNETAFIHDNHVTKHNVACFHCHREISHTVPQAGTKDLQYECSLCHSDVHDLQKDLYKGIGARDVVAMPSPMYLANVDCIGCHLEEKAGRSPASKETTRTAGDQGCLKCHGKEYLGILDNVHDLMRATTKLLGENLEAIKEELPEDLDKNKHAAEIRLGLENADYNLKYIRDSHSIHNIYYAAQVLASTDKTLSKIARRIGADIEDTSEEPLLTGEYCGTLCHSKVGVQVPPEMLTVKNLEFPKSVAFKKMEFSHATHVEDEEMKCTTCHTFGQHKKVGLLSTRKCQLCHEKEEE